VTRPGPIDSGPLELTDFEVPQPGPGEVRVRVSTCGVCRTDLHIAEGDLALPRPGIVPGHEIVGAVDALGDGAARFSIGSRIGIAWLRGTCGRCRFCAAGRENLCLSPAFTGFDAHGGYAEFAVVNEGYAYELPTGISDDEAAPLLCAGIIGYRALKLSQLPPGGRLGVFGFGGSAHLAVQVAAAQGAEVHVFTRSERARRLALDLGAASAEANPGEGRDLLDSAILYAPAGELVPVALSALDRGGTLVVAGIHLSDIPSLRYAPHLFHERKITSVTANTRSDGREFLDIAARIGIEVSTVPFPLDEADRALAALAHGDVTGAAVLRVAA
jgi:alcohol dehydrogenase, propanol-preferring